MTERTATAASLDDTEQPAKRQKVLDPAHYDSDGFEIGGFTAAADETKLIDMMGHPVECKQVVHKNMFRRSIGRAICVQLTFKFTDAQIAAGLGNWVDIGTLHTGGGGRYTMKVNMREQHARGTYQVKLHELTTSSLLLGYSVHPGAELTRPEAGSIPYAYNPLVTCDNGKSEADVDVSLRLYLSDSAIRHPSRGSELAVMQWQHTLDYKGDAAVAIKCVDGELKIDGRVFEPHDMPMKRKMFTRFKDAKTSDWTPATLATATALCRMVAVGTISREFMMSIDAPQLRQFFNVYQMWLRDDASITRACEAIAVQWMACNPDVATPFNMLPYLSDSYREVVNKAAHKAVLDHHLTIEATD